MRPGIKGLAGSVVEYPQDIEILDVDWFYNWTVTASSLNNPKYIPMLKTGDVDFSLPTDYSGYVLVFNEPDVSEPFGTPIPANVAAQKYDTLIKIYTNAVFVIGGVTAANYQWLEDFHAYCVTNNIPIPSYWHIHGYCGAGISVMNNFQRITNAHVAVGGIFWVTEYNSFDGILADVKATTKWLTEQNWIERVAIFTNRNHPQMSTIDNNGNLTDIGRYYAAL